MPEFNVFVSVDGTSSERHDSDCPATFSDAADACTCMPTVSSSERRCDAVDAETQYQIDSIRARRFSNFHGTAEEWVEFEYGLVGKCVLPATRAGEATTTPTEAAEIDRLTSELKAVQERAASEISELAVAVTDLKFELHNAGFEIEQFNSEVGRLRRRINV
jgi:hypothetical protein